MTGGPICSKCGAPIRWAVTVNGRMQPLDREPAPDGNLRLCEDEFVRSARGEVSPRVRVIPKAELESLFPPEGPRYVSHFATCEHAEEFRKRSA